MRRLSIVVAATLIAGAAFAEEDDFIPWTGPSDAALAEPPAPAPPPAPPPA
ncbi:MAG: acid-shock protein, partial [Myxococcaceae bacterium]|nr:acid-shock protein [Myxococcaceae bacterium]